MKTYDLSPTERKHYYNDSDIFNIRPPKSPEKYKIKKYLPNKKSNNFNTISTDTIRILKNNKGKQNYYYTQKDHINDCLRSKTPLPSFMNNKYKKYKTTRELKRKSKKIQLDKSYEYDYDDNNNIYKKITSNGKNGTIFLGNEPTYFDSEYNRMHDYAKRVLLKKTINKEKLLNKSFDSTIPLRKKYNKKHLTKDIFSKNTINFDLNKSTDNILLNRKKYFNNNYLNYYKSNIFFDKEKEKTNEQLDKIKYDNNIQRKKAQLYNIKLEKEKEKYYHPFVKGRKTNFLYEDLIRIKNGNLEDYKKYQRNGNYPPQYANYKPKKEIRIKSIDAEYNDKNRKLYNGLSEMERNTDKYVVLGITKNDKFDSREIKKLFFQNGIHMFGEQTFSSYIENGKKGKFVFNIRKDLKDKNYNEKLKKVLNILMQKQGIVFDIDNRIINHNKKKTDIKPPIAPFREIKPPKHTNVKTDIL